jgi:hypothetical protein
MTRARVMVRVPTTRSGEGRHANGHSSARRALRGRGHASRPETSGAPAMEKAPAGEAGGEAETRADVQFVRLERDGRRGQAGQRAQTPGCERAAAARTRWEREGEQAARRPGPEARAADATPSSALSRRPLPSTFHREHTLKKDELEDSERPCCSLSHSTPRLPAHETPQHRLVWWLRLTVSCAVLGLAKTPAASIVSHTRCT